MDLKTNINLCNELATALHNKFHYITTFYSVIQFLFSEYK